MARQKIFWLAATLSAVFATIIILTLDISCFPWIDEIGTSDTPVNVALYGKWFSEVWHYTYHPLHAFLLTGWVFLFGATHASICAFSVILAEICCILLVGILLKRDIIKHPIDAIILLILFFGGFTFFKEIVRARIDMLVMLFTILLTDALVPGRGLAGKGHGTVALLSFLLMLSGLYAIPYVCMEFVFLLIFSKKKGDRKEIFCKGLVSAGAITAAFALICLFYWYHDSLYPFLNTYVSFNATVGPQVNQFARIAGGYLLEPEGLLIFAAALFLLILKPGQLKWEYLLFIALTPAFMGLAGRYTECYTWLFYIPIITLFIYSVVCIDRKGLKYLALLAAIACALVRPVLFHDSLRANRERMDKIEHFIDGHSDMFLEKDVLIRDPYFYYSLVRTSSTIWYKDMMREGKENDGPYLPECGLFVCCESEAFSETHEYLISHGYTLEEQISEDGIHLFSFQYQTLLPK